MRKLLHTRAPTSAIDSCSVGKAKTTLMGTGMRTARLQASYTQLLITTNHRVLASEGTASAKWCMINPTTSVHSWFTIGPREKAK